MHAVSVRPHDTGGWRWEVVDPDGLTVAHGTASTYSEAVGRAWAQERALQSSAMELRPQARWRPRFS